MDLRPLITSKKQIEEARRLALRGLLSYQPYIFSDDFATGAGLSILAGHLTEPPAVYCKDATANDTDPAFFAREFAKENQREEFFAANESMRRFYDGMVDQIAKAVGPLDDMSVLDVGCNTGYFPLAFARRGARQAKGIDRIDYSPTVALLNDICGTSVQFANWNYDGSLTAPEQYDLVLSVAVLVHLSEPLRHLAWLGSSARKALMVFTPFHRATQYAALRQSPLLDSADQSALRNSAPANAAPDYSIKFHTVNRYYEHDKFPLCFDVTTVSEQLLRLAFEKMGFTQIIEITAGEHTMPPGWAGVHLGLLGLREDVAAAAPPTVATPITVTPAVAPVTSPAVAPPTLAPRKVTPEEYIQQLQKKSEEQLLSVKWQLASLEATLNERTGRIKSLEMAVEERTNRIASLEAVLEKLRRRSFFARVGALIMRNMGNG